MAIDGAQVQAFANAFVPYFLFDSRETIFPVSAESFLQQCAAGDWTDPTDPHAGTTVVASRTPLTTPDQLITSGGCAGGAGNPLSTAQPLPIPDAFEEGRDFELFLDFAGWESLTSGAGFTAGNDAFIEAFYQSWFSKLNGQLSFEGGSAPQRPGTNDPVPTQLMLYCEGAWAGEYTRLCIAQNCSDFAPSATNDPSNLQPDPALDPFFVLTYYLFYPCTEPPPGSTPTTALITNKREGQWEAVSFYFNAAPAAGGAVTPADLTLPPDPATVIPAFVVMSQGVLASRDGIATAGLSADYPAQVNTQTSPPTPTTVPSGSLGGGGLGGGGGLPTFPLFPGFPVYVTCGTHKNLFGLTPFSTTSDPNQGGLVAGGVVGSVGSGAAGAGIGIIVTVATSAGAANFWNPLGWVLLIVGLIALIVGAVVAAEAAGQTSSTPLPNPQGDTADGGGTSVGGSGSVGQSTPQSPIATNLTIFTTPTLSPELPPPAWWSFPGRWGVAMGPGATGWDSGAFLTDFKGRTRAYWNTVGTAARALIVSLGRGWDTRRIRRWRKLTAFELAELTAATALDRR